MVLSVKRTVFMDFDWLTNRRLSHHTCCLGSAVRNGSCPRNRQGDGDESSGAQMVSRLFFLAQLVGISSSYYFHKGSMSTRISVVVLTDFYPNLRIVWKLSINR
jgi:hypothetical protein